MAVNDVGNLGGYNVDPLNVNQVTNEDKLREMLSTSVPVVRDFILNNPQYFEPLPGRIRVLSTIDDCTDKNALWNFMREIVPTAIGGIYLYTSITTPGLFDLSNLKSPEVINNKIDGVKFAEYIINQPPTIGELDTAIHVATSNI